MEGRKSLLFPSSCLQLIALSGLFPLLNEVVKINTDPDLAVILSLHVCENSTVAFVTVDEVAVNLSGVQFQ